MANKNSFVLYKESYSMIQELSTEQKGALLDMIFKYAITHEEPHTDDVLLRVVFKSIQLYMDKDLQKYLEKCKKNAENASKRHSQQSTTPKKASNFAERDNNYDELERKLLGYN